MASISGTTRRLPEPSPLDLDQRLELGRVAHGDGARMVRHLLAGCVVVAVDGDGFHAQALQRDDHFLAEFAAAQQHDAGGRGGQGVPSVVIVDGRRKK
uniref:hypothetical protein n=1 Tax=Thauera sp. SDU_THAU2 TaxID=3136633 RepID=UPI00311F758F